MDFKSFNTGKDDEGRRLDRIIRKFLPAENLSQIYKALRSGLIKVNAKKSKAEYHICSGDVIMIASFLLENKTESKLKEQIKKPLDEKLIVFKNEHILFVNKPYDINVQKASNTDTALNEMVQADWNYYHSEEANLSFKTGPLHRLDRQTTGLIAFSQSIEGARWFSKAIQEHTAVKTYVAIVEGKMTKAEHWSDSISKDAGNNGGFHTVKTDSSDINAMESSTDAIPLQNGKYEGKDITLVKFIIHTGRTHQIRASSANHGWPLLGDTAYGAEKLTGRQLFLHAISLELPDNNLGIPSRIFCNPGQDFVKILSASLINWNGEL